MRLHCGTILRQSTADILTIWGGLVEVAIDWKSDINPSAAVRNGSGAYASSQGPRIQTLHNWRAMKIGPTFIKIGKAVLYPANELDAWDQKNTVTCRTSKGLDMDRGGGA
jgi:hypothetical protein